MTGIDQRLMQLLELARADGPPDVDLTEAIMTRIARTQVQVALWERQWMWMAGLSAAVAAIVAIAAIPYWQATPDPLAEVMEAVSWVIQ